VPVERQDEIATDFVSVSHSEVSGLREVYGYSEPNRVVLDGVRFVPQGRPSNTLLMYMHPTGTIRRLPVPRVMAAAGMHILCAESRYARNDTALIMEKVLSDYGAFVRHAKEVWGYTTVVLVGWSGGGSLTAFYQSQAEHPTIVDTPAGDPVDLSDLIPGDAFIYHAAHLGRAEMLRDFIDPSVLDEANPDIRDVELDLYDPRNPNQPPYPPDYLEYFRSQQSARIRRRTTYVKEMLEQLRRRGGSETERVILTHRTLADPRFLDATIDPNDREIGMSFMGVPQLANISPAGLARCSTLRGWLSQWSAEDSRARADIAARSIHVPLLAIENSADDAVPQPHTQQLLDACASADKTMHVIKGANHYYAGQDDILQDVVQLIREWLQDRDLLEP
jgi:pimeloyl-ACP methyl ester carboxylesterase